jgi:cytochrome c oxidase subunit 1
MLFAIGLVSTFITGGLTGIILGDSTLDINVHDTYFVVAHFHLVMGISALYGMFAGIYHWFPRMFGRMLNKNLGYIHFWVTAICAYVFPMHFIGLAGLLGVITPTQIFHYLMTYRMLMFDNYFRTDRWGISIIFI